ncbi:MAG: hypothetical protein RLZZ118_974 [Bacteroidota bacterium]|jgi:hypothetical protein
MIKKYLITILFFGFSFYQSASQNRNLTFTTIYNNRYGFCVDYPKNILYPQPLSGNGDGRHFSNKKGDQILTTYGRPNYNGDEKISLEEQYEEDLRSEDLVDEVTGTGKKVITYSKLESDYFVISGFYKGHIFYEKVVLKEEGFAYAILVYDEIEKQIYNQVAKRILKTFK